MASNWAASAFKWWQESGVDTFVAETPRDWLNPTAAPPRVSVAPAPEPPQAPLPGDLDGFRDWLRTGDDVPLARPGAKRVGPAGERHARLMVLVDMPSAEDVAAGSLVTGEVGAMFDRMLTKMGLSRNEVYLASLSPIRTPTAAFDSASAKHLARIALHHIGLVAPKAVLLFGDACSKALTGSSALAARGRWQILETSTGPIRAVVTMGLHYLHGQPSARRAAWDNDLQLLMEGLKP